MGVAIEGGDYSVARPTVKTMQDAGWKFVCRYLRDLDKSNGDKSLSLAEVTALKRGGLDLVSNEETTGQQGLTGWDGGVRDAQQAHLAHTDLGGPPDRPIYFSPWDHDPALLTSAQWTVMAGYLRGLASVLTLRRVGLYAGRAMLTWAFDNHLIAYGWQAAGWAHNGVEARAHIIQHVGSPILGTDSDTAVKTDYGQWGYKAPTSTVKTGVSDMLPLVRKVGDSAVYVVAGGQLLHIHTQELEAYAAIWKVDVGVARAAILDLKPDRPIWQLPIND